MKDRDTDTNEVIVIKANTLNICFLFEYIVAINSLTKALIQKYAFVFEPIPSTLTFCSVAIILVLKT